MTNISFFVNNVKVNNPKNWQEMNLGFDFSNDNPVPNVKVTDWNFVNENAEVVEQWIEDGFAFEGLPLRIEITEKAVTEVVFDGYIDLVAEHNLSCFNTTTKSAQLQGLDWLNDVADSFTFEYLAEYRKTITIDDYVFMPYVISTIPDYTNTILALIGSFVIYSELSDAIVKLKSIIVRLTNVFEWTAVLEAILFILYLSTLLYAIITLVKQMFDYLIQPTKYHASMNIKTLFQKGCEELNLSFASTIFDDVIFSKACIIPEKDSLIDNKSGIFGALFPSNKDQKGYYRGTFGDFIREMKTAFNAKIFILDGVLHFERADFNLSNTNGFTLPPIEQKFYSLNTGEFVSNFLVSFRTDVSDKNTIQEYSGTSLQVHLEPKIVRNEKYILSKGFDNIRIDFALAKRKNDLTFIEKILSEFLSLVNGLMNLVIDLTNGMISAINYISGVINDLIDFVDTFTPLTINFEIPSIPSLPAFNIGSSIQNRIGMMKLSSDNFNVKKIFILQAGTKSENNKLYSDASFLLTAELLWDKFHSIKSFVPTDANENGSQFKIIRKNNVPFCLEDFVRFKESNIITDSDGVLSEVVSIDWNYFKQTAEIEYKKKYLYTNNFFEIKTIQDGQ